MVKAEKIKDRRTIKKWGTVKGNWKERKDNLLQKSKRNITVKYNNKLRMYMWINNPKIVDLSTNKII